MLVVCPIFLNSDPALNFKKEILYHLKQKLKKKVLSKQNLNYVYLYRNYENIETLSPTEHCIQSYERLVKRLTADKLLRVWRKSDFILQTDAAKVRDKVSS